MSGRSRFVLAVLAMVSVAAAVAVGALKKHRTETLRVKPVACMRQIPPSTQPVTAADEKWKKLASGGHVLILRHTETTPGNTDPPNFRLEDRATQRNLSEQGQDQAKRIGEILRSRGVTVERVLSSQFYRCQDTARLAFGSVAVEPLLNAFPDGTDLQQAQLEKLRSMIGGLKPDATTVLVTHSGNIAALMPVNVPQGGGVVITPDGRGGFTVDGAITFTE